MDFSIAIPGFRSPFRPNPSTDRLQPGNVIDITPEGGFVRNMQQSQAQALKQRLCDSGNQMPMSIVQKDSRVGHHEENQESVSCDGDTATHWRQTLWKLERRYSVEAAERRDAAGKPNTR